MSYSCYIRNTNEFLENDEIDSISLKSDNDNNVNKLYYLEKETNWNNIGEQYFLDSSSCEGAWNTGGNIGNTDEDYKNKTCEKFMIDKLKYSEKEINDIIKNMNINNNDKTKLYLELDSKDAIIEEIKYQLNLKVRIRRKSGRIRRKINNDNF